MPLDIVIHKGEKRTSMYFIEKGDIAIFAENGMAYCILKQWNLADLVGHRFVY